MTYNEYMNKELKISAYLKVAEAVYNLEWENLETVEKEENCKTI